MKSIIFKSRELLYSLQQYQLSLSWKPQILVKCRLFAQNKQINNNSKPIIHKIQRMVHYGGLTTFETVLMGIIVIISNIFGVPSIVSLWRRKGLEFEAIITMLAIYTSAMYHLCQVLDHDLWLSEEQWHRLDNVFAISGISIYTLHISGNGHCRLTMYSTLMVSILTQEKDPWNIYYTFGPMILYEILSVCLRVYYWNKVDVKYNFNRVIASIVILVLAGQFFINGLDEKNDYLRFNHGLWHMFAGVAHYFGMNCTSWKDKVKDSHVVEDSIQATQ